MPDSSITIKTSKTPTLADDTLKGVSCEVSNENKKQETKDGSMRINGQNFCFPSVQLMLVLNYFCKSFRNSNLLQIYQSHIPALVSKIQPKISNKSKKCINHLLLKNYFHFIFKDCFF